MGIGLAFGLLLSGSVASFSMPSQGSNPAWLLEKLRAHRVKAERFLFQGETVFLIPARCCDIPSELFNEKGEKICNLGGGYANQNDAKCVDFSKEAKLVGRINLSEKTTK